MAPGRVPLRPSGDIVTTRDVEGLEVENADLRRQVHALESERMDLRNQVARQERALGALAGVKPIALVPVADVEQAVRRVMAEVLAQMLRDDPDRS